MKIVAPIPFLGRRALVPYTFHRLKKMGIIPIGIVKADKDRYLCEKYGIRCIQVKNYLLLGAKWNVGFNEARKMEADAVLFVGSSDWVSSNWLDELLPYLETNGMVGAAGIHYYMRIYNVRTSVLQAPRTYKDYLGYWPGYSCERKGEPIGGGRILRADTLDKIGWKPFDDDKDKNMDFQMYQRVLNTGDGVFCYTLNKAKSLSISTDLWPNKHDFWGDTSQAGSTKFIDIQKDKFLTKWFPEALQPWNVDGVYSHLK